MKYTIKDFKRQFPTDTSCLAYIFSKKFPKGFACSCGKKDALYPVTGRKSFACAFCGHHFSPTKGTIFEKSDTPLTLWFYAIYLFSVSKNGVSGKELQRQLGVTYKTAWRMARQIRALMGEDVGKLKGTVEMDDGFMGGKIGDREKVFGMVERRGKIKAKVVGKGSVKLTPLFRSSVEIGSELMTDGSRVFNKFSTSGYKHKAVNHSKKEWVRGRAHVNTIESFWAQLKRSITGTYHAVSKKHLQAYVDEFAFRYNHRDGVFGAMVGRI